MRDVAAILKAMGPEQLFLALVFLAGYALALGEFATARGRLVGSAAALLAAIGFAAFSKPWEAGIVLLGFASVGMALFSGAAWMLWAVTRSRPSPVAAVAVGVQSAAANLPRRRVASSSRSVKTAPILNSPAAE